MRLRHIRVNNNDEVKKNNFTIKDLLLDEHFIDFALNDEEGLSQEELNLHKSFDDCSVEMIEEACSIVNFRNRDRCIIDIEESHELKQRIINSILNK